LHGGHHQHENQPHGGGQGILEEGEVMEAVVDVISSTTK
jgi:tRNA G37 N-methylase TrmD